MCNTQASHAFTSRERLTNRDNVSRGAKSRRIETARLQGAAFERASSGPLVVLDRLVLDRHPAVDEQCRAVCTTRRARRTNVACAISFGSPQRPIGIRRRANFCLRSSPHRRVRVGGSRRRRRGCRGRQRSRDEHGLLGRKLGQSAQSGSQRKRIPIALRNSHGSGRKCQLAVSVPIASVWESEKSTSRSPSSA